MTKHTALGTEEEFFRKLREGSRIKQKIVSDYFVFYNRVMAQRNAKVGYADLFAGPGLYRTDDGASHKSIPVMVCESAVREPLLREKVHMWFNEGDPNNFLALKSAVGSVEGVETLRFAPTVTNRIVDARWAERLGRLRIPTFVFLDPCGYKGLSLSLVRSVLEGFGNDCIFFFNYSRINMKLDLEVMNASIDEFFESNRARDLRAAIQEKNSDEREKLILSAVKSAIQQADGIPLTFRFLSKMNRTSHHLVYASKNRKAAAAMKRILNSASSTIREGVGSWEHDPRARETPDSLFGGLYEVEERLLAVYAGKRLRFQSLLESEESQRFTESNYRDALLNLEREGRIRVEPPAEQRRFQSGGEKRILPKEVYIEFQESERRDGK